MAENVLDEGFAQLQIDSPEDISEKFSGPSKLLLACIKVFMQYLRHQLKI
jgi:hypothetical protein